MKTLEELKKTSNLLIRQISLDGGCGEIWQGGKAFASVIWSNGGGWEHVSMAPYKRNYTPTWNEMCRLKDMFFSDDEVVVQYHPAKSDYVNNKTNCLHLWRPLRETIPTPPSIMVGVRSGQTAAEVRQEIKQIMALQNNEPPTRDVVCCQDCENYKPVSPKCGNCHCTTYIMHPTDFCSRGKRKEKR